MQDMLNTTRVIRRRETEVFREKNHEELWTPNELTPVQEEVVIVQDFQPNTFHVLSDDEKAQIVHEGVLAGRTLATLADGTPCTIEELTMNLQLIEKLNDSLYTCKVVAVLETDPDDPKMAKKVMV